MAKILVTDDSNFLRRRTCSIIRQAGHEIIEASNGVECLERIRSEQPDVLFLDLVMPELDGIGVLKQMKSDASTLPVIVLTADIQESVRSECMDLGAAGFLNKPPQQEAVLAALEEALSSGSPT